MSAEPRLVAVRGDDADEVICTFSGDVVLLPCGQVVAVCMHLGEPVYCFGQRKRQFIFSVIEPDEYAQLKLDMWLRDDPKWDGRPPRASKLFKMTAVALGRLPGRRECITTRMFVGKAFRCRLHVSGKGPASYSVIAELLEKVAG